MVINMIFNCSKAGVAGDLFCGGYDFMRIVRYPFLKMSWIKDLLKLNLTTHIHIGCSSLLGYQITGTISTALITSYVLESIHITHVTHSSRFIVSPPYKLKFKIRV